MGLCLRVWSVQRVLLLSVYKLLDICTEHTLRQLNAVLPAAARHVFRLVHAEFNNYYKYSRRMSADAADDYIDRLYTN